MRLFLVIVSLFFSTSCFTQQVLKDSSQSLPKNIFWEGIYIENSKMLIPWGSSFSQISNYGNPEIMCKSKTITEIKWKSSVILDSIVADVWCTYFKCFLRNNPKGNFYTAYASIDSSDIIKLKNYFEKYTGVVGRLIVKKRNYYYYWIIDNCNVKLGYNSIDNAYLRIQKRA